MGGRRRLGNETGNCSRRTKVSLFSLFALEIWQKLWVASSSKSFLFVNKLVVVSVAMFLTERINAARAAAIIAEFLVCFFDEMNFDSNLLI